jgi:hypothetical protein
MTYFRRLMRWYYGPLDPRELALGLGEFETRYYLD